MYGICLLIEPNPFTKIENLQSGWNESLSLAKVTLETLHAIRHSKDVQSFNHK